MPGGDPQQPTLADDLQARGMELRETHISQVFLAAHDVYKIKKPVDFGFLDFRTLEAREHYCHREVELNRRLAPRVYHGVLPIRRDPAGHHVLGGDPALGPPVDWAVHMLRLPDADAADQRLSTGSLGREQVEALASHLARFHASARADEETARFGAPEVIEGNVRENFEQTADSATHYLSAREVGALRDWQLGFLSEHRTRFEARARAGRVRDGHGDLRLEHCYLDADGRVDVIDCIEFNERFRYGDVCADIAFLAMDLAWHERPDLAEALVAAYARESGDYDLYGVVDFYESYRAHVRAKISSFVAEDEHAESAARSRAAALARKYYLLAEACTREPLSPPRVIVVGGAIASGKSEMARRLGAHFGAPIVDADRTRKQLAGVAPETPLHDAAFSGHYGPEMTARVYAEVVRRAAVVLDSGRPVILEATYRAREHRLQARALAARVNVPFHFVECSAPEAVLRERLEQRARGTSISDGRSDILTSFLASLEPVEELGPGEHVPVDTRRTPGDSFEAALAGLGEGQSG